MKEEKAKSKKKLIYYVTLAISLVLLIVATVLTVCFVTGAGNNDVLENPPVITPPDDKPDDDKKPEDQTPDEPKKPDEDKPTGGDDAVKFVIPLTYQSVTEEYNDIYRSATTGFIYRHKAVDFAADEGTEICSMADGTVLEISLNETTGNYVTVDHGDGLITLYRFIEPKQGLKTGDKVKKGDAIGTVAAAYGSEAKDGTHLHLEVMLGDEAQDPADYIEIVYAEK